MLARLIPDHNVERHYCDNIVSRKIGHAR